MIPAAPLQHYDSPSGGGRFKEAILIVSVAVLPFVIEPFRFEGFETHRAGILAILVILAFLFIRPTWKSIPVSNRILIGVVVCWVIVLTASSLFSLSPLRSIAGDLTRRMGLVTQIVLLGAIFIGATTHALGRYWRWFWISGLVGAVYVILEATGLLWSSALIGRAPGSMGSSTFTGGWLAILIVWVSFSMAKPSRSWQSLLDWGGVVVMIVGFLLLGSRGPTVALGAGIVTGILCRFTARQRSSVLIWITRSALLLSFAVIFTTGLDVKSQTIIDLKLDSVLSALEFRGKLWWDTIPIINQWPALATIDEQPDQWSALRPLIGYGLEMFETPYRLQLDYKLGGYALGQRIDRAHNDWIDTLIQTGWLGFVARLALWLSAFWLGLRRLGRPFPFWWLLLPVLMGIAAASRAYQLAPPIMGAMTSSYANALSQAGIDAIVLTFTYPLVPLAGTMSGLIGLWLLLTIRPRSTPLHNPSFSAATVILAVLATHLVDLQFSFTTIATALPTFLALGSLLSPRLKLDLSTDSMPETSRLWAYTAIAGMYLLRYFVAEDAKPVAIVVLLALLLLLPQALKQRRSAPPIALPVVWAFGIAGALLKAPIPAALWDITTLVISLILFANVPISFGVAGKIARQFALALVVLALSLLLWTRDIAADIYLQSSLHEWPEQKAADSVAALSLRPWDDRLFAAASKAMSDFSLSDENHVNTDELAFAYSLLQHAAQIQPYNSDYALQLAGIEANLGLLGQNPSSSLRAAETHFASASRLWPFEAGVWREWGRFALEVQKQPALALALLKHADALDNADAATHDLITRAEAAN